MTAEQRVILDLVDVLALRLECVRCGAAVVLKPRDWNHAPFQCPGCRNTWDLPRPSESGHTPINYFGIGLRRLLEQATPSSGTVTPGEDAAVPAPVPMPYRVKIEIRDPLAEHGDGADV